MSCRANACGKAKDTAGGSTMDDSIAKQDKAASELDADDAASAKLTNPIALYTAALAEFDRSAGRPVCRPGVRRIVMLAIAAFRIDPRIEREARALATQGFEVIVVGPDISSPKHSELPIDWGPGVRFDLLPFESAYFINSPPYFYCPEMTERALQHEAFAVHGHDVWTSFIAMEVAERTGAYLVIDYHEWGSENVTWDQDLEQWVPLPTEQADAFRKLERIALRRADIAITVNQTIARALEDMASIAHGSVVVFRNIPSLDLQPTRPYPPLKRQLDLPGDAITVIYQGGTGPTRLLEPVIESLALLPANLRLVIRGPSLDLFGDGYRAIAERAGVADRLILRDGVPSRDVVAAAKGADIGLWSLPDLSKNFRFALPNKIFEYLAAGLPLAVANYPEAAHIVRTWNCGETFDPYSPTDIAAAIGRMLDPAVRARYAKATKDALEALDAKREWASYAEMYEALWSRDVTKPLAKLPKPQPDTPTKQLRVLHAPCNIGNQAWTLSRSERKLGLGSDVVSSYSTWLGYPADLVLGKMSSADELELARRRAWGFGSVLNYDVLHCYYGRSLLFWDDLPQHNESPFADLRLARRLGKPVFMTLQGCDVRIASESHARNSHTPCAEGRCSSFGLCVETLDEGRRAMMREVIPLCDQVFILNPELGHSVPDALFSPYANVDIWSLPQAPPRATGHPRIAHGPADPQLKGSDILIAALERLAERYDFDFVQVGEMSHAEAMETYRSADIVIDQLLFGWYGGFAVEMMAMGKPVACYLRDADFHFAPPKLIGDLPIFNIRPETLEADLEKMLERREEWAAWGERSRQFVEKWHDPDKIAQWMASMYRAPRTRREFNPDEYSP